MKIHKYLKKYCNDNKAEFARQFGRHPQNVGHYFSRESEYKVIITDRRDILVQTTGKQEYIFVGEALHIVRGERLK